MKKYNNRKTIESKTQKIILDFLRIKGCYVFKHRNIGLWNQKIKSYIKLPENEIGIADIIGLTREGRFIAVEVKSRGETPCKDGKPSQEQLNFLEEIKRRKGIGIIAYDLDDVIKNFE